jgi:hypothetical protein
MAAEQAPNTGREFDLYGNALAPSNNPDALPDDAFKGYEYPENPSIVTGI